MIHGYLYWCYTEVRANHIADWLTAKGQHKEVM